MTPRGGRALGARRAPSPKASSRTRPAMMPLINPTPNCYHRVKPYTFAPSNVSWGVAGPLGAWCASRRPTTSARTSRCAAARRPAIPISSPSAVLAAGLLGVEGQGEAARPVARLRPARTIRRCRNSRRRSTPRSTRSRRTGDARDAWARISCSVFMAVKRFELARFHAHVSDWEVNEYLELY